MFVIKSFLYVCTLHDIDPVQLESLSKNLSDDYIGVDTVCVSEGMSDTILLRERWPSKGFGKPKGIIDAFIPFEGIVCITRYGVTIPR